MGPMKVQVTSGLLNGGPESSPPDFGHRAQPAAFTVLDFSYVGPFGPPSNSVYVVVDHVASNRA